MCIYELIQSALTEHGPIQASFTSCVHITQDIGLCRGLPLQTLSSGLYMHFSSPQIGVLSPEVANYHLKGLTDNCPKRQVSAMHIQPCSINTLCSIISMCTLYIDNTSQVYFE